jgi:hypothetical protein
MRLIGELDSVVFINDCLEKLQGAFDFLYDACDSDLDCDPNEFVDGASIKLIL